VWRARPDGHIDYVNKRLLEYLGSPVEEIVGWGWMKKVHPDDLVFKVQTWLGNLEAIASHDAYCRFQGADGVYRWFNVRGEPLRDDGGRVENWYGVLIDIDEQKKAEDELRDARAKLERASHAATVAELSASIAHEINQPLAGIVASAETCRAWLSGDNPNLPRALAATDRIIRDGNAAADIIRRIRALFKQMEPVKTSLHINEVIGEVRRLAQDELNRRGVLIETDLAQALPPVLADRIQIQQVLMNLIRNGAEAMEDANGQIKRLVVRSHREDGSIAVEVCDHGPGLMHPEKAFEPFYSTKQNGLGVGLGISRFIAQAHGGALRVRDNQPRGTVFALTLPLRLEANDDAKV
jgi:PAS domain S-box-containing protein